MENPWELFLHPFVFPHKEFLLFIENGKIPQIGISAAFQGKKVGKSPLKTGGKADLKVKNEGKNFWNGSKIPEN